MRLNPRFGPTSMLCVLALVLWCGLTLVAQERQPSVTSTTVQGTVTRVDAPSKQLTLRTGEGRELTFRLDNQTAIRMGDQEAALTAFKEGSRATVTYEFRGGTPVVMKVQGQAQTEARAQADPERKDPERKPERPVGEPAKDQAVPITVVGKIVRVEKDLDAMTIKTVDGKDLPLVIDEDLRYRIRNGKAGTVDFTAGNQVKVVYIVKDSKNLLVSVSDPAARETQPREQPEKKPVAGQGNVGAAGGTGTVAGRVIRVRDDLVIVVTPKEDFFVLATPSSRRVVAAAANTLAGLREGTDIQVTYEMQDGRLVARAVTATPAAPGAAPAPGGLGFGGPTSGTTVAGTGGQTTVVAPGGGTAVVPVPTTGGVVAPGTLVGPFPGGIAPLATDRTRGTISRIVGDTVFIRTPDGREVALLTSSSTRFRFGTHDASLKAFPIGTPVELAFAQSGGQTVATLSAVQGQPVVPGAGAQAPVQGVTPAPPGAITGVPPGAVTGVPPGAIPSASATGALAVGAPTLPSPFQGTITGVSGNTIFMRTAAGQQFAIPVTAQTQFLFNNQAARLGQFTTGTGISVTHNPTAPVGSGLMIRNAPSAVRP